MRGPRISCTESCQHRQKVCPQELERSVEREDMGLGKSGEMFSTACAGRWAYLPTNAVFSLVPEGF